MCFVNLIFCIIKCGRKFICSNNIESSVFLSFSIILSHHDNTIMRFIILDFNDQSMQHLINHDTYIHYVCGDITGSTSIAVSPCTCNYICTCDLCLVLS